MKQEMLSIARRIYMLPLLEKLKFLSMALKAYQVNGKYSHRDEKRLYPPYSLMYDAYSHCSHRAYDETGLHDAKLIMQIIRKFTQIINLLSASSAAVLREL